MTNVKLCSTAFNQKLIVVESKLKITLIENCFVYKKATPIIFTLHKHVFRKYIYITIKVDI